MKKSVFIVISIILIVSLFLSACGSSSDNSDSDNSSSPSIPGGSDSGSSVDSVEESNLTEPGTFPIVKDKITLKVLVVDTGRVEDIQTNDFTQWYEELTNVHIEWDITPRAQAIEKLNLMLASGDYPDVIMKFNIQPSQLMVYGDQGIFLPLNEMIEEHGYFSKQLLEEKPLIKDAITSTNGNIYSLPMYSECFHCSNRMKMWINEPWLNNLNLDMPTTTEEFYQVLKAFKENDPNGNGLNDEIPLVASNTAGNDLSIQSFLMNAFVYYDPVLNKGMLINNGILEPAYTKDEFKQGLQYLNRLYNEGLLGPETFTQDRDQLRKLVENPGVSIVGAVPALSPSSVAQVGSESGRWLELKPVAPLKGPNGHQVANFNPYFSFGVSGYIITNVSKHPEVALRWGEAFYNEEIMMRARFGVENEGWHWIEGQGKSSIDGGEARWERLTAYGNVQNSHLGQMNHDYQSMEFRHSESANNPDENLEVILYNATKNHYQPYNQSIDNILPPLWFTEDQAGELTEMETTITGYVEEMIARFVIGDADLDREWENYLRTLDNMGLNRYLEIYQRAYDAFK